MPPRDAFAEASVAGGAAAFAESLSTLTTRFDPADADLLEAAGQPAGEPSLEWPAAAGLVMIVGIAGVSTQTARRSTRAH